jgi:alanyl-tRNA synthetase
MRFDFTHYEKVSDEQLKTIEALVNRFIFEKHPVRFDLMKLDEAKASGAMALFSEKYEAEVRVVTMGSVSKELCGGTHVNNTQEIGLFKIVSEESIGSGIRRLTTKTQADAYQDFVAYKEQLERIAELFKANSINAIENRVDLALKEASELRHDVALLKQQLATLEARSLSSQIKKGSVCDVLVARVDQDANALKLLAESIKPHVNDGLIVLGGAVGDKLYFVAISGSKAIAAGYKAGDIVKGLAQKTGGNGGGRPDFAQAGGKDVNALNQVLAELSEQVVKS